jgi:aminoglycoside phosphotransferase (APT) family kinase protein
MTLQVKLEGRSGCPIRIVEKGGQIYVNKGSASLTYNDRLNKQASKQNEFKSIYSENLSLRAPEVYSVGVAQDGLAFFEMEYARGEKFSDFFPGLSLPQLDLVVEIFINYFHSAINNATWMEVPLATTKLKTDEVQQKVIPMTHYSEELKHALFTFLHDKKPVAPLPQSFCHGDFTFSNMLFKENGQIYVFDFLDSFIESPLIDLVKLRQDTKFLWSVLIDENLEDHKVTKVIQILKYMDSKLAMFLSGLTPDLQQWYTYLEVFNLARIMPYAHKQTDFQFLNRSLTQLLNSK